MLVALAALCAAATAGATGCAGAPSVAAPRPAPATSRVQVSARPGSPMSARGAAAHLGRSAPTRLQIPSVGVDSALMRLGLRADGSMQVPATGFPAGWYTGGPTPGELGPAVIAGHVDMRGPGVFFRLHDVSPGDQVTLTRADGSKPVFRVTRVAQFPKDQFPTQLVYGNIDHAGLRLITCGGSFNAASGHYEDNLVVFADLVAAPR